MVTSSQITNTVQKQPNPGAAMFKMWLKTRYLVAQMPAAADSDVTKPGYFNGRVVVPGPKAHKTMSEHLGMPTGSQRDFETMMNRHHIRFVDNRTTDNADESVRRALFTIMTNEEADAYEAALKKYYDNKRKGISS